MGLVPPYINGFIPYYSFDVDTKTNARVTVENADDLTKGFSQSVNVSVRNESWMKYDEFENMIIHVTGIKGWILFQWLLLRQKKLIQNSIMNLIIILMKPEQGLS
jgi:hypothetical protein